MNRRFSLGSRIHPLFVVIPHKEIQKSAGLVIVLELQIFNKFKFSNSQDNFPFPSTLPAEESERGYEEYHDPEFP